MNWHQQKAARRAYELRNTPAHILRNDFIQTGLTLCGVKDPEVWVSAEHRHSPANKCCPRCLSIADKLAE
jgi:hypothetical protein